jgi:hypothetical protein
MDREGSTQMSRRPGLFCIFDVLFVLFIFPVQQKNRDPESDENIGTFFSFMVLHFCSLFSASARSVFAWPPFGRIHALEGSSCRAVISNPIAHITIRKKEKRFLS